MPPRKHKENLVLPYYSINLVDYSVINVVKYDQAAVSWPNQGQPAAQPGRVYIGSPYLCIFWRIAV